MIVKKLSPNLHRMLALVLAAAMLLSLAACAQTPGQDQQLNQGGTDAVPGENTENNESTRPSQGADAETLPGEPVEEGSTETLPAEYDRESMEQIVEVLGGSTDTSNMDDAALGELVEDLIQDLDKQGDQDIVDLGGQDGRPTTEVEPDAGAYDENGAMTDPFDQVYPELVANGDVAYDEETLLVKMNNSYGGAVTSGMAAAGVAALEVIVPMPETSWYEAKLVAGTDAAAALAQLRQLSEILMAEYNYEIQTSQIDHYKDWPGDRDYDNNKHHKDQWHMHHCGIPDGFEQMKTDGGSSSVVVAVIDTGVDYDHEDLAQNIWVNSDEVPDDGIDNDGNGYVDDYYGVDIVAGRGSGDDDNGHGTHVAGIIAAQNNNLGVVGIAYNVKIMPIKAAMASGYLHQSDIAKAVLYAYENGAEVINMSFGGTACSIAVQDALAVAYTRCVLVASAGNDGAPNEGMFAIPNYPAALTYVLGVMSVDEQGVESNFTNYDVLGFNGVEYELYAPGSNIMSTLPGDRYGILSGTSMAAPVVSAMAAILRSEFSDRDTYPTKFIYGQLASTSDYNATCLDPQVHGLHNLPQIVNLHSALTKLPTPEVGLQDYALFDTKGFTQDEAGVNSGEGVIDAGETIALGLTLRNRWGMSKDTIVKIDTLSVAGVPDPYITILNDTVNYGSVGTYSTQDCGRIYTDELLTGWEDPFYIRIAPNCPNDYIFRLNVTISCGNGLNENDGGTYVTTGTIELEVRNGTVVPSVISEDMVWTADNLYIIPNATVIEQGVTVRVEPGTHIQFWTSDEEDPYADNYIAYLRVDGTFLVEGTKDDPVYIYPSDLMDRYVVDFGATENGTVILKYADITNMCRTDASRTGRISAAYGCVFRNNYGDYFCYRYLNNGKVVEGQDWGGTYPTFKQAENCVFYKVGRAWNPMYLRGNLKRCIFVDSGLHMGNYNGSTYQDCVFLGNNFHDQTHPDGYQNSSFVMESFSDTGLKVDPSYLSLFYRPETGTTYVSYYSNPYTNSEENGDQQMRLYVQELGGDFAIIETEEENRFLAEHVFGTGLGLTYDILKGEYVWADGSELPNFLKQPGLTDVWQDNELYYNGGVLSNDEGHYSNDRLIHYLYEIPGEVYLTDFVLPEYEVLLDMEATYRLSVSASPANVEAEKLIFESRDENVAKVDETGLVTPVGLGTTDIYIYSGDKALSTYVTVTVKDYVALAGVSLTAPRQELPVGETMLLASTLTPVDTTRRNLTYTSSDPNVAQVDKYGNVTGISSGEAVITAASAELDAEGQPITASVTIRVYKQITHLSINELALQGTVAEGALELPGYTHDASGEPVLTWRSTDTAVADIAEGKLVLKQPGTTTLILEDSRSGLTASCPVIVTEAQVTAVKKIEVDSRYHYALLENGDLYYWDDAYHTTPIRVTTGVQEFSAYSGYCMTAKSDGTLEEWRCDYTSPTLWRTYTYFTGKTITTVEFLSAGNRNYFCTVDGSTYAWGDLNDNGQLGVGIRSDVEEPMLVNLDDVTEIAATHGTTYFLTGSGDLYYAGNDSQKAAEPVLLAQEVAHLAGYAGYSEIHFQMRNGNPAWISINSGVTDERNAADSAGVKMDKLAVYSISDKWLGILNGQVYTRSYSAENSQWTLVEGIRNAVDIYTYGDFHYVMTADNLLYGFGGQGSTNRTAGQSDQANVTAPVLIMMETPAEETITITGTNLSAENVLTGDELVLTFNKTLGNSGARLYEGETQITVSSHIENYNQLRLTRSAGFKEGVTYRLVLPAGALIGPANVTNGEDITVEFTWAAAAVTAPDEGTEDTEVKEPVVRQAVLDETVERFYWTAENLTEKLNALEEELNLNAVFLGNVILNRLSTDTDVTHWLRIQGGESDTPVSFGIGGNYWGTTNETAIGLQIIDYSDFPNYAKLEYAPYLTTAPENTFPFVTGIAIFNKAGEVVSTVGNEEITVQVYFNRDMDTSMPLRVVFGSAFPYGDYEIQGSFISPRCWQGTHLLTTIIENGYQLFTVSNGRTADGLLDLWPDQGRFGFVIDTTAAQALIMQGNATDTGIQLKWTQDDFDTLMGYNVYRSTSEDGYYQRLNSTVIPAGQMEFFDDTVEPGVQYYYNFTVVKTDLTESTPSGKITIMSRDTMAPDIYHSPVYNATTGQNLVITATVTDNLNIIYSNIYYRIAGTEEWKTVRMNNLNSKYSAIIPASDITMAGLEYYLEAFDGVSYTYKGSAEEPFTVTVQEAVDKNSLGDVNGDGVISNLDALLLLYAINDKVNLSAEEFARADLNGDGELWAAEALRILQYVSGVVGSVTMP